MTELIRTWNLFHGNADPPVRRGHLHRMVELASADAPGVLCLQEVPVWALARLDDWSGMHRFAVITRPPLWPGPVGRWVTRLHQGLFRSALSGQANALLVARRLRAEDLGHARISDHGRERRLVQAVRIAGVGVVANLHASNELTRPEIPRAEVTRAQAFVESVARPGEPIVLAGDFNLVAPRLEGYSAPAPGIDHVLVRGAPCSTPVVWERERRTVEGIVLSDHAPVEVHVG
jgi:endonuclease/exonuclease/phosphatase family metal-dependent hydrolase